MPTHLDRKGNTIMTNQQQRIGGVDSHKETVHLAVITDTGQPVADREFPTTVAGYRRAVAWLIEHGPLQAVGVEGTSSYGVGITTGLLNAGVRVVEVNRTRPAEKRRRGKTDPLDAYRAARSVLSGEATTDPKSYRERQPRARRSLSRAITLSRIAARHGVNSHGHRSDHHLSPGGPPSHTSR
ncbi:MAG: IS110 family transposase [Actinobacteria bacterium]|nr:IS110 family transposase [Actinomycetota bacterium]